MGDAPKTPVAFGDARRVLAERLCSDHEHQSMTWHGQPCGECIDWAGSLLPDLVLRRVGAALAAHDERLTWSEYQKRYTPASAESGVLRDPEPPTAGVPPNESFTVPTRVTEVRTPVPGACDVAEGGQPETDSGAEGGQLDPADDLLAEADDYTQGAIGPSGTLYGNDLVPRLASALRSWRAAYEVIWQELAEARSHGEVLYRGPVHAFRYDCPPGTEVLVVLAPAEKTDD